MSHRLLSAKQVLWPTGFFPLFHPARFQEFSGHSLCLNRGAQPSARLYWVPSVFLSLLYLWLCWVFVAGSSPAVVNESCSSVQSSRSSLQRLPLLQSAGCRARGLQQLWLLGSRAQVQWLWRSGLAAPQHVEPSQTADWTCVSCIDRQILYHWPTREAFLFFFNH